VAGKVAIVYVGGDNDDVVPVQENGARMHAEYERLGGAFKLIHREGEGHHPHGLADATPVLNFMQHHAFGNSEPTHEAISYGPHPKQVLDFWRAPSDKPTPVAVYIHGGGWSGGSRLDVGSVETFLKSGISVAAVEYRFISEATADGVVPPVKGPMSDSARAIQFLRSKSAEWNIRKDRFAAWGGSAGGCSSLWLAFHKDMGDASSQDLVSRESTRLVAVAAVAPQTTLDPAQMKEWTPNSRYGAQSFGISGTKSADSFTTFLAERERLLPWIAEYSPYALATEDAPPVFMSFPAPPELGKEQKDPTHTANFGVKLQERLAELRVECEVVYPGAPETKHKNAVDFLIEKLNAQ
jgi:acetyl esterase/lipase